MWVRMVFEGTTDQRPAQGTDYIVKRKNNQSTFWSKTHLYLETN